MRRVRSGVALAMALMLVLSFVPIATGSPISPQAVELRPDAYEPADDNPVTAPMLAEVTMHTLHDTDDEDWSVITAEEVDQPFVLEAEPLAPGYQVDLHMYVYEMNEDGTAGALLDENDDGTFNTYGSTIYFEAPAAGDYLVKIATHSAGSFGTYRLTEAYGIARRIAGANRFATSVAVSKTLYPMTDLYYNYGQYPPAAIVVANGLNYADALAGAAFANQIDGVLLLTQPTFLPSEVSAEIRRLLTAVGTYDSSANFIEEVPCYVLGGTTAVSNDVVDTLETFDGFASVERLAGTSRYGTAAAIGDELYDLTSPSGAAFVVSGLSPWDALAVSPVAAAADAPVLMVTKDMVPAETAAFITDNNISTVVVVGGTGVISTAVETALDALAPVTLVERVAGVNRYDTAREVAQHGVDMHGMDPGTVVFASGQNFADGLSAGTISGYTDGPMLLVGKDMVPDEVYQFFDDNGLPTAPSYVVGGPAAISSDTYEEIQLGIWFTLQP